VYLIKKLLKICEMKSWWRQKKIRLQYIH